MPLNLDKSTGQQLAASEVNAIGAAVDAIGDPETVVHTDGGEIPREILPETIFTSSDGVTEDPTVYETVEDVDPETEADIVKLILKLVPLGNKIGHLIGKITDKVVYVDVLGNDGTGQVGNILRPFKTIDAALDASTAVPYLTMKCGAGYDSDSFTITHSKLRSHFRFIGAGKPISDRVVTQASLTSITYTAATKLVYGTVIKGGFNLGYGNATKVNVKFEDCGIDNGSALIAAGGSAQNGIGIVDDDNNEGGNLPAPTYPLIEGCVIKNVCILLPSSSDPHHCIVIETNYKTVIHGCTIIGGVHGIAVKSPATITDCDCYDNGYNSYIIKANDYSPAQDVIIDRCTGNNSLVGIKLQNKSNAVMSGVHISNCIFRNVTTGVDTSSDFGQAFSNITLNVVTVYGATTAFANSSNYHMMMCFDNNTHVQNVITEGGGGGEEEYTWTNLALVGADIENIGGNVWRTLTSITDDTYGHPGKDATGLPAATPGIIKFDYDTSHDDGAMLGISTTNTLHGFGTNLLSVNIFAGVFQLFSGSAGAGTTAATIGRQYGLMRDVAGDWFAVESTDGQTWTVKITPGVNNNGEVWGMGDIAGNTSLYQLNNPQRSW